MLNMIRYKSSNHILEKIYVNGNPSLLNDGK